jgi:hypothetical protein
MREEGRRTNRSDHRQGKGERGKVKGGRAEASKLGGWEDIKMEVERV